MENSYIFENVTVTLDEGDTYQALYYHKGFLFVALDERNVSFVPIDDAELLPVIQDPMNKVIDRIPDQTIKVLEDMINGHEMDYSVDGIIYTFNRLD